MKRSTRKFLFKGVLLGLMLFLFPAISGALDTLYLGEESELTFYGFFRNNAGIFLEDQPYRESGNDLATLRTWFRGYMDYTISDKFKFWAAVQFVHEPRYKVESGSTTSTEKPQHGGETKGWKEYSEYRNINDILREAYIEWNPSNKHSFKIGRQIVIWGEALTSRVGDVVHPEDGRFTLAFANIEDTRIPSWMIRGMHDISSLSTSFEWIYNPNVVQSMYTVNRGGSIPIMGIGPGQRFAPFNEDRHRPPEAFVFSGLATGPPMSRDSLALAPGVVVPTTIPSLKAEYPSGWWDDARGGFRTSTLAKGYTFGVSYFRTQNYNPVVKRGALTGNLIILPPPAPPTPERQYILSYLNIDIFGAYMNKQLTGGVPGVVRADVIYVPNQPFNTFDLSDTDAVVRRDYVKYMLAWDLTGLLYFQWHKTAPIDLTFEHTGEWLPRNKDIQYALFATEMNEWTPAFNMRISTNWHYNLFSTALIFGYIPFGDSGLIMPSVGYTPAWFNESISFNLQYIKVFSSTPYKGLGLMERKDMLVLTTQFNW